MLPICTGANGPSPPWQDKSHPCCRISSRDAKTEPLGDPALGPAPQAAGEGGINHSTVSLHPVSRISRSGCLAGRGAAAGSDPGCVSGQERQLAAPTPQPRLAGACCASRASASSDQACPARGFALGLSQRGCRAMWPRELRPPGCPQCRFTAAFGGAWLTGRLLQPLRVLPPRSPCSRGGGHGKGGLTQSPKGESALPPWCAQHLLMAEPWAETERGGWMGLGGPKPPFPSFPAVPGALWLRPPGFHLDYTFQA